MPLTQLNFQPGIDTENTQTGAEGRWTDGDKDRKSTRLNSSHMSESRMPSSA